MQERVEGLECYGLLHQQLLGMSYPHPLPQQQ